jgi:hypothetical protein
VKGDFRFGASVAAAMTHPWPARGLGHCSFSKNQIFLNLSFARMQCPRSNAVHKQFDKALANPRSTIGQARARQQSQTRISLEFMIFGVLSVSPESTKKKRPKKKMSAHFLDCFLFFLEMPEGPKIGNHG